MQTEIINGKEIAQKILDQIKKQLQQFQMTPKLLIIQVGENHASTQYVSLKKKRGEELGISVKVIQFKELKFEDTLHSIETAIKDSQDSVDGIMIQLPLPPEFDTQKILSLIPKELDVDGLLLSQSTRNTAVADAVIELMQTQQEISRVSPILIIGDSPYVGASILTALKKSDYEYVTTINELSQHKQQHMRKAKVVVSCMGKATLYSAKQLHKGAILIDVGTSKNEDGKIVGDFDVSKATGYLTAYTPVPGGIGPMTVCILLRNVAENAIKRRSVV